MSVIVFDGFIIIEEQIFDAIIVRSFDNSSDEGLIFAQPYAPKQNTVGIDTIGNARLLGKEENIIKDNSKDKPKRPLWKIKN
jgi:hypothetical protein